MFPSTWPRHRCSKLVSSSDGHVPLGCDDEALAATSGYEHRAQSTLLHDMPDGVDGEPMATPVNSSASSAAEKSIRKVASKPPELGEFDSKPQTLNPKLIP